MRSFLAASLLLPAGALAATGLNTAAKAAGLLYFGTATDNNELTDTAYVAELDNTADWGQLTAANSMKWGPTEPSNGVYSFAQGDQIVSTAEANGQLMRCHNLAWYNELPSWLSSESSWTNATLLAAFEAHITATVTHYKGQCYCWDVVNEALNDDGTYRSFILYDIIGPAYIPLAFKYAAAADPDVKLYYNDYNIEYAGAKATAAQNIVKLVQSYGYKIDGVGLQSHFIVGETPSTASQVANLNSFSALGVETALTELDVRMTLPDTAAQDTQQSADYVSTVNACVQAKNCVGVTVWDFDDKYSWVPSTFSGQGNACLFNSQLQAKPAYTAVLNALEAAAKTGSGSAPSTTTKAAAAPTTTTKAAAAPTTTTKAVTTAAAAPTTVKTTVKTTTAAAAPTAAPPAGGAAHWAQCGGQGWSGATTCQAPYTCKAANAYYSQCL